MEAQIQKPVTDQEPLPDRPNPWREVPPSAEVQSYEQQVGSAGNLEVLKAEIPVNDQELVTNALINRFKEKHAAIAEETRLRSQVPESRPSVGLRGLNKR